VLEDEPLGEVEARQLIRKILEGENGQVLFSRHARLESMPDENITEDEIIRCLATGFCSGVTFERSSWRYTMEIPRLAVVVAFNTETNAIVVTTWRIK
jgi:hypothetical protein